MTDNETRPQCRAQLHMDDSDPYRCILTENHAAMHRDQDGDTWDVTYVDEPQCPVTTDGGTFRCSQCQWHEGPHTIQLLAPEPEASPVDIRVRPVQDQLTALMVRVGLLEARMNPVCGHRDPSSGLACQRPPDHYGEVHSTATDRLDGTVWSTGHSSAEHREGQKRNEGVLIDPVELGKLREASERLTALEAAGVDNWSGYGHAMSILHGDDD